MTRFPRTEDKAVRVWDLARRREIGPLLTGHTEEVNAVVAVELDGRPVAVTGSDDKTVRVWDLKSQRCVDQLVMPGPVGSIAYTTCGPLVVGYGFDIASFDPSAPLRARSVPKLFSPPPTRRAF